jgi:hypothetical protein
MRATAPPAHIGLLDGYLTVVFGHSHFHLCIGETKGSRRNPTPEVLAHHRRAARAELYRQIGAGGAPVSWGLRLFNGAGEQQITILLPIRSCRPTVTRSSRNQTGRASPCGTGCGAAGSALPIPIRSTAPGGRFGTREQKRIRRYTSDIKGDIPCRTSHRPRPPAGSDCCGLRCWLRPASVSASASPAPFRWRRSRRLLP